MEDRAEVMGPVNQRSQQVHAVNRERMLAERRAMQERFVMPTEIKRGGPLSARWSRGVAEVETRELRIRSCLRCGEDFKSEGAHNRMCCSCAGLPEGFLGL